MTKSRPRWRASWCWVAAARGHGIGCGGTDRGRGDADVAGTLAQGSASEAIQDLKADGFNVMINWLEGHPNVPCRNAKSTRSMIPTVRRSARRPFRPSTST